MPEAIWADDDSGLSSRDLPDQARHEWRRLPQCSGDIHLAHAEINTTKCKFISHHICKVFSYMCMHVVWLLGFPELSLRKAKQNVNLKWNGKLWKNTKSMEVNKRKNQEHEEISWIFKGQSLAPSSPATS